MVGEMLENVREIVEEIRSTGVVSALRRRLLGGPLLLKERRSK